MEGDITAPKAEVKKEVPTIPLKKKAQRYYVGNFTVF